MNDVILVFCDSHGEETNGNVRVGQHVVLNVFHREIMSSIRSDVGHYACVMCANINMHRLTLSRAKLNITVHMLCNLHYMTKKQYVVDCKVLNV